MYPRYDTYPGLHRALTSLEELNDTLRQRHNAGYNGGERLFEWVILGRFYLDSCGNAMKYVGDHIPAVMFPGIPEVLDRQAFFEYVQRNLPGQECPSFTASMGDDIPPANLICPECGARWTVKDCHDTVVSHETRVVSLKDFVGRPLSAAKKLWAKSEHTVWRIQPEKSVRNDIYIDHTIVDSDLGREYKWEVNERGWIEAGDDYIVLPDDEALVNIWTYRHLTCHRQQQSSAEYSYFEKIFKDAGFNRVTLTAIPNQYCPCERCAPWYRVTANGLEFTLGWRKRVISLQSDDRRLNFKKLFPGEDVTKEEHYIHAWGTDKCVEYLKRIKDYCNV